MWIDKHRIIEEIFIRILFRWRIPRLVRTERTQRENRVVKSTYILGQCSLDPRPFLRYSRRRDVQPYESRMWRLTVDDLATSSASHQNRSDAARVSYIINIQSINDTTFKYFFFFIEKIVWERINSKNV